MPPQNPDVIVVGAGTAGLAAAKSLQDAGMQTLVLEAAGHTGGRCVTDGATFSVPFDRGGSWLHSAQINPLARLAEQSATPLHKTAWTPTKVHISGYDLSTDDLAVYQQYQSDMWDAINDRGLRAPDVTAQACLPDGPWQKTAACNIAQMLSGDGDVASARDNALYDDAEGDWLVAGGLGAFVQDLYQDVPVTLNTAVSKIDYAGQGVCVTCSSGVVRAKYVVLTVSTGVLASDTLEFVPPLPVAKRDAVTMLPNGLLNKVGIEFDPAWAEAGEGQMAEYNAGGDAHCSLLFGFFGSPLAVGFVAGRHAAALEREGNGSATAFCLQALRAIFGNDITKYIRKTDETAWNSNPLTLGSYSYAKPGGSDARQTLAAPLTERLFFAGEATMTGSNSTVHGAYLSGLRAAEQILAARAKSGTRQTTTKKQAPARQIIP